MSIWNNTLDALKEAAEEHDHACVAYSGGKDSMVVMDLCTRAFKHVSAFYMYPVPGLAINEQVVRSAKERFGVPTLLYPHWTFIRNLKEGIFCTDHMAKEDIPDLDLRTIYEMAMADSKATCIAHGAKEADSLWRKRMFNATKGWAFMFYPARKWNKLDVISYLKMRKLPIPESSGRAATGVDLSTPSVLWLHDEHRDDFEILCKWFPFARAIVKRRELYGIA